MARQCFANARFELDVEEGRDLVEEFFNEEIPMSEQHAHRHDVTHVQALQQGLQGSVRAVN